MKKLFLNFCFLFSLLSLNAQVYLNAEADKIVKGSKLVTFDENTGTIKYFSFPTSGIGQQFTKDGKEFLKSKLNLSGDYDLSVLNSTYDKFGKHIKYQFTYKNIPVDGYVFGIQMNDNKVLSANGYYKLSSEKIKNNFAQISEKEAFEKALNYVKAKKYQWEIDVNYTKPASKLYYIDKNGELVLVYQFDIYSAEPLSRQYIYINAETGEVEKTTERIHIYTNDSGTAVTKYQGTKTIKTDFNGGTYRLRENSRGNGIETYDLNNSTSYSSAVDFTDADNYWNTTTNQDNAAYDAHYGTEATYDYYFNNFGRNSIDGSGFALKSYVHYSSGYVNAYWNGSCMTYGDGDGSSYTALTSIDIVAHEITHGLTSNTSNLNYSYESGALNESFSDIFGTAIDFYANPATANYLMGDQISVSGTPFRSMINPNLYSQPDTYLGSYWHTGSGDNGGVHYNSGVQNYWFYLLCVGGSGTNDNGNAFSVSPIGMDKAAAIAYKTLTVYLTPTSQYADARYYSIQSALDLYGECSPEVINVTNAWYAVGVGAAYSNAVIANFRVSQNYFCTYPATVQFTNSSINATTYLWDFGDGTSSTLLNPAHTYNSVGNYTVTLISTGVSACSSTDTLVSPNPIIVTNSSGPVSATCTPTTINTTGVHGIIDFSFNGITNSTLGSADGYKDYTCQFSSTVTEGLTYAYSISVGTSNASMVKMWIDLNNDGQFNNTNELLVNATNTTATKTGIINIPHPTIYDTPLRLRIASDMNSGSYLADACTNSEYGQYEDYSVIIQQNSLPPVAKFSASGTSVNPGQTVLFTDSSLNLPTSWVWTLPGGTPSTSTVQNPVITYNTLGTYPVKLKVQNSYGHDSIEKTSYINVVNTYNMCSTTSSVATKGILYDSGGPTGDYQNNENCAFLIDPGCATSITLTFTSFNLETDWDYIYVYDGTNSSGTLLLRATGSSLPPPVTASTGKMFIVIASDVIVASSGFEANWTSVFPTGTPPNADFIVDDDNPPLNSVVQFTDQSTNSPNAWLWNFGDGTTSTLQNPMHSFSTPGVKTITLTSSNCYGSGNITDNINVQDAPVINVDPAYFSKTIHSCDDSISSILIIKNTGNGSLSWNSNKTYSSVSDDFDPGVDNSVWQSIMGGYAANTCGSHSAPNSLYFNGGSTREAITNPINTFFGGTINFHLEISNGTAPCERADTGENVIFSYSTNGGSTWKIIQTYFTGSYNVFTPISEIIPVGAKTNATLFKWSQPSNSGSGCDNWSIDDVSVIPESNPLYSISPESGIIIPGDSTEVTVEMKSKGLGSGYYNDSIIINSNDPLATVKKIGYDLTITGDPELVLSDTCIHFGNLFCSLSKKDTLFLFNTGCDTLFITNITSSLREFSVDQTNFAVLPYDTGIVTITFAPISIDNFNGYLQIFYHDADTILCLSGVGIAPPVIAVAPDAFNVLITECNDSITLPLKIYNTGGSDLTFEIQGNSTETIELLALTYGVDYGQEFQNTMNAIDQYFTGYNLTEINTTDPTALQTALSGKDVLLIPEQETGSSSVFTGFASVLQSFVNNGGTVIFCGMINSGCVTNTGLFTGSYISNTDGTLNVLNTTHPITDQVSAPFAASNATFYYDLTNTDAIRLVGYNSYDVVTYREIGRGKAIYIAFDYYAFDDNAAHIIANSVKWAGTGSLPLWMEITAFTGTISSGDSINIGIEFNSTGLSSGIYTDSVVINSNDPLNPTMSVACSLNFTGVPEMALSETFLDFGESFPGQTKTDTLLIYNMGCDTLHVTEISSSLSEFSVDKSFINIIPGDTGIVHIAFTPPSNDIFNGILSFQTNDPQSTEVEISLSGECVLPPLIEVSVDSLSAQLMAGDSVNLSFTIQNNGSSNLHFTIEKLFSQGFGTSPIIENSINSFQLPESYTNTEYKPNAAVSPVLSSVQKAFYLKMQNALHDSSIIFSDDFEQEYKGWIHYATSNTDNWNFNSTRSASGQYCWNVAQHSGTGSDALQSPVIDLTACGDALLSFNHWYNFDDCGDMSLHPDGGIVEISRDNGINWIQIQPIEGYSNLINSYCSTPFSGYSVYSNDGGDGNNFIPAYFDLSSYAGDEVIIRFHAGWDCGNCAGNEGWYIDDVAIYSRNIYPWLTFEPQSDTITAGSSAVVSVKLNAKDLNEGVFNTNLFISNNDPLTPLVTIPVHLEVDGVPEISISDTLLVFDETGIGRTWNDTLIVSNSGTALLTVSNIETDSPFFFVSDTDFSIEPGKSESVIVTFSPDNTIMYTANLTINSDAITTPSINISLEGSGIVNRDSLALVALYNAANGANWYYQNNWLTGPLNTWYGVTVTNERVTHLNLESNNLQGHIPAEIGYLTGLNSFKIIGNYGLTGIIPGEIGLLKKLRELCFFNNSLSGTIPVGIWELTNLTTLNLSNNSGMSGQIPAEIGNLIKLENLLLAEIHLSGTVPSQLLDLTNLIHLDLSFNNFTAAPIPDFGSLTNLNVLNAIGCNFTGSIPASIFQLSSLYYLYLHNNQLSGSIPVSIGNLTNLRLLSLSDNQLSGPIPTEIGNLSLLNYCYLNNNQLSGTIPASIGNLTNLNSLYLNNNQLTGSIPTEFGNLSSLYDCYLNNNRLSGNLPPSLSSIIDNIILSSKQTAESLPSEKEESYGSYPSFDMDGKLVNNSPEKALDNLHRFDIRNNKFTFANIETSGIVPGSIGYFKYSPQDTILGLSYIPENSLTVNDGKAQNTNYQWYYNVELVAGETNDTITNIEETGGYYCSVTNTTYPDLKLTSEIYGTINYNLTTDSLSLVAFYNATQGNNWYNNNNWLTGPLNTWYGVTIAGDRVTQLYLRNNYLVGYLPDEIGNLTALTSLNIGYNYGITGSMPDEIGNLSALTVLNLYNNGHSGNIPSSIWNLTNLTTLNLGACWSLEGAFPTEIGNLTNLTYIDLYGIGLTGSIPTGIGNLTSIQVLQLGSNNLTGTIPAGVGNLSNLENLILNSNQLSGSIPSEIGNLSNLRYCYLNNNQLQGSIPATFGNLSILYQLQLNNNSLSGNIPTEFGNLSNLQYCYLNNNQLSGDLPASFSTILNTKAAPPLQKTGTLNNYISNGFINTPTIGSDGLPVGDAPANLLTNLYRLQVQNNRFTFANLEASGITHGSIGDFQYAPQDTIFGLTVIPDHSLTVIDGKARNSIYQWYYCGKLITGETNDTLVDINPTGDYYCKVTNTNYPALQLNSEVYGIPWQGFILSRDTVIVAATEGSTNSLSISSQAEWIATPNDAWLSVSPESGTGNGSITVTGSVNAGEKRTGTITVSSPGYHDLTLTVIQLSALEVDPTTVSLLELEGSSATLNVTASVDWTVSSDQLWLSVAPESGSGNGTITLTATKNKGDKRFATVTVSSPGLSDKIITVTQARSANVYVIFTSTSPVIDGIEEATWDNIVPIQISKDFQTETPTVTAYWKAMWTDNGLYVLMNVHDNDHYPSWETVGPTYQYDKTDLYFDVNETLIDGKGPAAAATGHFQSAPGFTESGYDVPVISSPTDTRTPGGDYAYHLDGENYVYEQFFPFGNFYTEENVQMDKDAFTSRPIGFDVTITDQDEGITTSRQRMVWMQDGKGDVLDESWNNMDDVGTIRLVDEIFNVAPIANAGNDQWVNEEIKVYLNGSASSDADGDELSYLWTAPAGITLSSNTAAQPTFTAPSVTSPTTYCFTLVVSDGIENSKRDTVIIKVMDALPPEHFETVWTGDAINQMNINVVSVNIDSIEMEPGDEIGVFDGDLCVGVGVCPGVTRKRNIAWLGNNIRYDSLYFVELTEAGYNVVDKTATKGDLTPSQIADLDTFDLVILSRSMNSSDYRYPEKYDAIQTPLLCMSNVAARNPRLRIFPQPNIDDASIQDVMSVIDLDHPIFNNLTLSGSNTIDIANPGINLKPLMDQKSAGNGNLIGVTSIDGLVIVAEWDAKQPYYEGSIDTLHGKRMVYFNTQGSNNAGQTESFLSNNGYQLLKNIAEYMITGNVAEQKNDNTNVIYISENYRNDSLYVDLLRKNDCNVKVVTNLSGVTPSDSALQVLEAADVIIFSRNTISAGYQAAEYNNLATPAMTMHAYMARSSRWQLLETTSVVDYLVDTVTAMVPDHPIFDGVTLNYENKIALTSTEKISVCAIESAGNATLIAKSPNEGYVAIAEWKKNTRFYDGTTAKALGHRMLFSSTGYYDFTENAEKVFVNAVKYLATYDYDTVLSVASPHDISSTQINTDNQNLGATNTAKIIPIVVSADDGSGNGYTPGHTLTFKLYDKSRDKEIDNVAALYLDDDPLWSTDGKFSAGATSFVELTGSVVPQNLTIANLTLSDGAIDCFDAHDTIIVAGGGTTVLLETNSTATFIAGASIRFLPGFHAESGSNMDAYITTTNSFCDLYEPLIIEAPVAEAIVVEKSAIETDKPGKNNLGAAKMLKVYPNPNDGRFTVNIQNFAKEVEISVLNLSGKVIYQQIGSDQEQFKITLPINAPGLYYVRVSDGKSFKTGKIVVY